MQVRKVGKDVLFDYKGINSAFAKITGMDGCADDEVLILDGMSDEDTNTTIKHENEENTAIGDVRVEHLGEKTVITISGEMYWPVHTRLLKKYEDYKAVEAKSMDKLIRKEVDVLKKDGKIVISTATPDRGGDRVNPQGGHFDNYLKNPIVMWLHDYKGQTPAAGIPIARCTNLEINNNSIISDEPIFLSGDPFAERVKNAWTQGYIKTASIGFAPLEEPKKNDFGGYDYDEWELLEWSLVPIPMNAEAMRIAKAQGFEELLEKPPVTKPEVTENYVRIPVEDSDKHKDHRIRTIDISAKDGIKALYCGECKVVITYLFDKDKWTMEKAKKWVEEHKKTIDIMSILGTQLNITDKEVTQSEIADELDYVKAIVRKGDFNQINEKLLNELFIELKRYLGDETPVINKAPDSRRIVGEALNACKECETHLEACKVLIKSEKDGLNFLLPPPETPKAEGILEAFTKARNKVFGGN